MSLKETQTQTIEVLPLGQIQVRDEYHILRDGEIVATNYVRHVLSPGADLSNESERVKAIAEATWTEKVIADWIAMKEAEEAELGD